MAQIKVFGKADPRALEQLERCAQQADFGVLCADNHVGYSQPIGGAVAYEDFISPSGVGYDIACLAAGARVSTTDGFYLPVERVPTGTPILCHDRGRARLSTPAEGTIARPQQKVFQLKLLNGRSVELTGDHRLLGRGGWIAADELAVGDLVACSPYVGLPFEPGEAIPPVLVRLLGYVNGD